jgi:hypothetical protein
MSLPAVNADFTQRGSLFTVAISKATQLFTSTLSLPRAAGIFEGSTSLGCGFVVWIGFQNRRVGCELGLLLTCSAKTAATINTKRTKHRASSQHTHKHVRILFINRQCGSSEHGLL